MLLCDFLCLIYVYYIYFMYTYTVHMGLVRFYRFFVCEILWVVDVCLCVFCLRIVNVFYHNYFLLVCDVFFVCGILWIVDVCMCFV